MVWCGKIAGTNQAVEITAHQGMITSVRKIDQKQADNLPWISAGWIDLQVNGYGGYDLNGTATTLEDIEGVTRALHEQGVTTYLPTIITGHYDRMHQAVATIAQYCRESRYASDSIIGIHLEGPYLSSEDGSRGAHPREHTKDPDWDEFQRLQDAAQGLIRVVTLAPERVGSVRFIEKLTERSIVVALGHTMATEQELDAAIRAGATLSTHLGNGSQPVLPRHPNYIWSQLADDRLWATFIPDGHHLSPDVLKAMTRVKRDKTIFVSDCTQFGGMEPGEYTSLIGGKVVLTETGLLHTAENPRILAGSATSLAMAIVNVTKYTDLDLAEVLDAMTIRPATVMQEPAMGRLEEGYPAHLTLFHFDQGQSHRVTIQETVVSGVSVFRGRIGEEQVYYS